MSKQKSHHTIPNSNKGRYIKKVGAGRASKHLDTKKEAIDKVWEITKNQRTELYIHGKDGEIQQKVSHENDPCLLKDKN